MTFPVLVAVARKDHYVAFGIEDRDLSSIFARECVFSEEFVHHLLCGETLPQKLQGARPVTDVHIRLSRYSTDVRLSPRYNRADREVSAGNRCTQISRRRIDGDDGKRRHRMTR